MEHPELGRLYRTGDIGKVNVEKRRRMTMVEIRVSFFTSSLDLLYFVFESTTSWTSTLFLCFVPKSLLTFLRRNFLPCAF